MNFASTESAHPLPVNHGFHQFRSHYLTASTLIESSQFEASYTHLKTSWQACLVLLNLESEPKTDDEILEWNHASQVFGSEDLGAFLSSLNEVTANAFSSKMEEAYPLCFERYLVIFHQALGQFQRMFSETELLGGTKPSPFSRLSTRSFWMQYGPWFLGILVFLGAAGWLSLKYKDFQEEQPITKSYNVSGLLWYGWNDSGPTSGIGEWKFVADGSWQVHELNLGQPLPLGRLRLDPLQLKRGHFELDWVDVVGPDGQTVRRLKCSRQTEGWNFNQMVPRDPNASVCHFSPETPDPHFLTPQFPPTLASRVRLRMRVYRETPFVWWLLKGTDNGS